MLKKQLILLGTHTIEFFQLISEFAGMTVNSVLNIRKLWFYRRQLVEQMYQFSVKTLPLVAMISVFVGLVATVQGTYQTSDLIPRYFTVNVIYKSTVLELSPVILALVLAGKVGASIAAEIGSMKITEQIEALESLSLEPIAFLVTPKIVAAIFMLPVVTIFANFFALSSAYFISVKVVGWVSTAEFIRGLKLDFVPFELVLGSVIKPSVFGGMIALVGSFFGLKTEGGARGVGQAATRAVVVAAVMVVIMDYYLGELFL
ncbi:MAG: ABC transporter permease [Calditrichia bacterium]